MRARATLAHSVAASANAGYDPVQRNPMHRLLSLSVIRNWKLSRRLGRRAGLAGTRLPDLAARLQVLDRRQLGSGILSWQ